MKCEKKNKNECSVNSLKYFFYSLSPTAVQSNFSHKLFFIWSQQNFSFANVFQSFLHNCHAIRNISCTMPYSSWSYHLSRSDPCHDVIKKMVKASTKLISKALTQLRRIGVTQLIRKLQCTKIELASRQQQARHCATETLEMKQLGATILAQPFGSGSVGSMSQQGAVVRTPGDLVPAYLATKKMLQDSSLF